MFFPYSSEVDDGRIRMASVAIVVVCLVAFFFFWRAQEKAEERIQQQIYQTLQNSQDGVSDPTLLLEQLQTNTVQVMQRVQHLRDSLLQYTPVYTYGFVPAKPSLLGLLTSMFLHAGFLHLFGNLLFFYVCGVAMEKYWGFYRFSALYLGGGVFASLFYAVFSFLASGHASALPLVGASGAIAATMGGFLGVYPKKHIKIMYIISFRPGKFLMQARWYLGFWFVGELVYSILFSGMPGGGTAYAAHVGGFLFGYVASKLVKGESQEFEEKFQEVQAKANAAVAAGLVPEFLPKQTPIELAWLAWERGDVDTARAEFSKQFSLWAQQSGTANADLAEALEQIFRKARRLQFAPIQYCEWGLLLARGNYRRAALGCLEMAVQGKAALSPILLGRCYLAAAEQYEALGLNAQRAKALRAMAGDGALPQ